MTELVKTVKIINSPFHPGVETTLGLVLSVTAPYSDRSVTLMVNPAALDYQEHPVDTPQFQVRQALVMGSTDETQQLLFSFDGDTEHSIVVRGESFRLRLLSIGRIEEQGQKFPFFEFMVSTAHA